MLKWITGLAGIATIYEAIRFAAMWDFVASKLSTPMCYVAAGLYVWALICALALVIMSIAMFMWEHAERKEGQAYETRS